MYGSCAAIVPIAVVLFNKGSAGHCSRLHDGHGCTQPAEAIMLRRTMQLQLIGFYFGITTLAIIFTGYLLNLLARIL